MSTALQSASLQLAREEKRAKREALELAMRQQLMAEHLTKGMAREFIFHHERKWRFDFAWPERKWALEVEGGTWTISRHTTGRGFQDDCEKYAAAALAGWRVLRATSGQVTKGIALEWVKGALLPKAMPSLLEGIDLLEGGELALPKHKRISSPKYLGEVAKEDCINCGRVGFSQAAHINRGKGMALKTDDNKTFALCTVGPHGQGCHEKYDSYQLGDKHLSADMGERWSRTTYNKLKREGRVPMNLPPPKF